MEPRKRITGEQREQLAKNLRERYEAGASIRELAGELNRSYGNVHRLLTGSGVTLRGRGGPNAGSGRGPRRAKKIGDADRRTYVERLEGEFGRRRRRR